MTGPGSRRVDRAHRVEQMGADRRARLNRRPGLLIGCLSVPDGGDHARIDDPRDRIECTFALGSDGDHPDRAAGRIEDAGRSRRDPGHASGPAGARRTARSTARDPPDGFRRSPPRARRSANPVTCRSNSSGPAVTNEATSVVVPCLRWKSTAVAVSAARRGREIRPTPAVHVGVDEPRHHRHRAEVSIGRPRRRTSADRDRRGRPTPQSIRAATALGP